EVVWPAICRRKQQRPPEEGLYLQAF
ncbi:hypothetical protein A2U01_0112638, partial [Trifolium medium]|nr:hypothetical protein [Trifolium medium]